MENKIGISKSLIMIGLIIILATGACGNKEIVVPASDPTPNIVTKTGWFVTIRNGGTHYSISDDEGETSQLSIEEDQLAEVGGVLALDRQRVTIVGEIMADSPNIIRVISIQIEAND